MTTTTTSSTPKAKNFYEDTDKKGIFAYIWSTDHKRIGLLYLYSILTFFIVAILLGLLIRLELMTPGEDVIGADTYNRVFTLHGVIMIFLVIIPGIPAALGNIIMPIMIGAKDVSFPKLNLFSWYLYLIGALFALYTLGTNNFPDTGWTFYAPYSVESPSAVIPALIAAFVLGFSSILTGLNFLVTIHRLRAPGMTWMKMPLFPWALYGTAWIQLLATPIVGVTLLMVIGERFLGIGFFDPAQGGDPVLYQHLFWIYSHPVVYVMILPAMGIISEIIPTMSQKTIFGYKAIVYSTMLIAFVGYFVWGHHMYTSGMSKVSVVIFSLLTLLVAIPSAIKVFNWLATIYKGSISLEIPFYWAASFIFFFTAAGLTGVLLGLLGPDVQVHDTVFVVAHFHYTMFGSVGVAFIAGMHYWFPIINGRMYNKRVAFIGWLLFFIGFNITFIPMFVLGLQGMPRRYFDYVPEFAGLNLVSTFGSWILVTGLFVVIINLVRGARFGKKSPKNPWNGITLEWTAVDMPPSKENFDEVPTVTRGPYEY